MSAIVVWDENGVVLDVEIYNPINDGKRDERVAAAIAAIAARIGGNAPAELKSRSKTDDQGREWGRVTSDDIKPGMVEIGMGKWGYE